jgi:hypothetical protein
MVNYNDNEKEINNDNECERERKNDENESEREREREQENVNLPFQPCNRSCETMQFLYLANWKPAWFIQPKSSCHRRRCHRGGLKSARGISNEKRTISFSCKIAGSRTKPKKLHCIKFCDSLFFDEKPCTNNWSGVSRPNDNRPNKFRIREKMIT